MAANKTVASRPAKSTISMGEDLLHDPRLNKGTAFTDAERDTLKIRGLLPPRIFTLAEQQWRVLENLRRKESELEKYIFLTSLQDRNETLFYRAVIDNIREMMPIIYTPTVGEACRKFGHIFRRPRGLYITIKDRGRVRDVLRNWPEDKVDIIVVTDGERILGLGDLGAQGMGIPIGKLSLYTACAGIDPARCLPITLDVGTNNEELLKDPLYIGLMQHRQRGDDYDAFIEEFVEAVQDVFPGVLIQFEDFATQNAVHLLEVYRGRACMFNDDIQGTAAVTLAGLFSAGRIVDVKLTDQTILFLGAGSAATGIAHLIASAMMGQGMAEDEAMRRCWFVDSKGLVVASRRDLAEHKLPFAHDHAFIPDLLGAVEALGPTALVGVSAQPKTFTEPILRAMARLNDRPIVLALSNPTSKSECTAEEAYRWTDGRAVFASGSPFDEVTYQGQTFVPGQGNNAYIFPGVGLGVIASGATRVTDAMFHAAARTLAESVDEDLLKQGSIYPPLESIRQVSAAVALSVAHVAFEQGQAAGPAPSDMQAHIASMMYDPNYREHA
ncbi:MAG TPA: NAD-dependent malic enzyme [Gemmatimonadales bacterium]|nr:NAD-dependent malic enzyme [Gemmatimonadales bacterium]